jgi:hypothetical protein
LRPLFAALLLPYLGSDAKKVVNGNGEQSPLQGDNRSEYQ